MKESNEMCMHCYFLLALPGFKSSGLCGNRNSKKFHQSVELKDLCCEQFQECPVIRKEED